MLKAFWINYSFQYVKHSITDGLKKMAAKNLIIEYKYSKGNTTLVWYKHKEKKKKRREDLPHYHRLKQSTWLKQLVKRMWTICYYSKYRGTWLFFLGFGVTTLKKGLSMTKREETVRYLSMGCIWYYISLELQYKTGHKDRHGTVMYKGTHTCDWEDTGSENRSA